MIAGIKVLVVDDEQPDRAVIAENLRKQFCTVLEAEDVSSAMALFDLHLDSVQLLVADISLPDGNGCALAIAIQKQQPDLRVLFVSGYVGSEVCKYYGLDVTDLHFLRKPFSRAELLTRVQTLLNSEMPFPQLYTPKTFTSGQMP
jgi:DNA-binding response OmpR family regulator